MSINSINNKQQHFSNSYEEEPTFTNNDNFKTSTPHKLSANISNYRSNKKREELELSEEEEEEESNNSYNNNNDRTRLTRRSLAAFSSSSSPTTPSLQRQQQREQSSPSNSPIITATPITTRIINNSPSSRLINPNSVISNITRDLMLQQQSKTYANQFNDSNTAPPSTSSSTLVGEERYERKIVVTGNLKGKGKESRDSETIRGIRESGYSPSYTFKAREEEESLEEEEEETEEDSIDKEIEEELSSSPHRTTTTRRTTEELSSFLDKKVAARTSISSASGSNNNPSIPPTPPPIVPRLSLTPTSTPSPSKSRMRPLPPTTTSTSTSVTSTPQAPGSFPVPSPVGRRSSLPLLTRLPPPPPPSLMSPRISPSSLKSSPATTPTTITPISNGTVQVQQAFNKYINGPEGALTISAERRRKSQSVSEQSSIQREQLRLEREKELEKEKEKEKQKVIEKEPGTPRVTVGRWPDTPVASTATLSLVEEVAMSPTNRYDPIIPAVVPLCVETEASRHSKDLLEYNNRRESLKSIGEEERIVIEAELVEEIDETEVPFKEGRSRGYEGDLSEESDEEGEVEAELDDINQRSTVRFAMADNSDSDEDAEGSLEQSVPPLPSPIPVTPSPQSASSSSRQRSYTPELPASSPARSISPPLPPLMPTPQSSPFKSSRFRQPQPSSTQTSPVEEWPRTPAYYSNSNTPRPSFPTLPAITTTTTTSGPKSVTRIMTVVEEMEPSSPFAVVPTTPTSTSSSPKPVFSPVSKSIIQNEVVSPSAGGVVPITIVASVTVGSPVTVPRLPSNSISPSPKYRHSSSRPKSTSPVEPSISAFPQVGSNSTSNSPVANGRPTPPSSSGQQQQIHSPAPRLPQLNSSSHFRSPSNISNNYNPSSSFINNTGSPSPGASIRRVASIQSPIPTSPSPISRPTISNTTPTKSISSPIISAAVVAPVSVERVIVKPLQATSDYDPPSLTATPAPAPAPAPALASLPVPGSAPAAVTTSRPTPVARPESPRVVPSSKHTRNISVITPTSVYDLPPTTPILAPVNSRVESPRIFPANRHSRNISVANFGSNYNLPSNIIPTSVYDPPSSNVTVIPPVPAVSPVPASVPASVPVARVPSPRVVPGRSHIRHASVANFGSNYDLPSPVATPAVVTLTIAPIASAATSNYDTPSLVPVKNVPSSSATSNYEPVANKSASPIARNIPIPSSTSVYDPPSVEPSILSDRKISTSSATSNYDLPTDRKASNSSSTPSYNSSTFSDRKISTSSSISSYELNNDRKISTSSSISNYDPLISDRKVSTTSITSNYDPPSLLSSPAERKVSLSSGTSYYDPASSISSSPAARKVSLSNATSNYDPPSLVAEQQRRISTSTQDSPEATTSSRKTSLTTPNFNSPLLINRRSSTSSLNYDSSPSNNSQERRRSSSSVNDPPPSFSNNYSNNPSSRRVSSSSNYEPASIPTEEKTSISATSVYDPPASRKTSSSTSTSTYDPPVTPITPITPTSPYDLPASTKSNYEPLPFVSPPSLKELPAAIPQVIEAVVPESQDHLLSLASELLVAVKSLATTSTSPTISPIQSTSNTPYTSPSKSINKVLPPMLTPNLNMRGLPLPPPPPISSAYLRKEGKVEKKKDSIADVMERRKQESDARREELNAEIQGWEVEDQKGEEERDELTRELEREQDLAIGIEDRLEEIKRSIEEMGMNVGVKVATVVQESLQLEARKRSNWLLWALVVQLIFLWFVIRVINTRSISHFESIYSDPFSTLTLRLPYPSSMNRYNQISAETLSIFAVEGSESNGLGDEVVQVGLKVLGHSWQLVKDGFEWYTRS